jgi:hypothetical protein
MTTTTRVPHLIRLVRCRHCGIRITSAERLMPWKACSEDCADEIWIKRELKKHPESML